MSSARGLDGRRGEQQAAGEDFRSLDATRFSICASLQAFRIDDGGRQPHHIIKLALLSLKHLLELVGNDGAGDDRSL